MICSSSTTFTFDRTLVKRGLAVLAFLAVPAYAAQGDGAQAMQAAKKALQAGDGIAAEAELRRAMQAGVPRQRIAAPMGEAELLQGERAQARDWLQDGDFVPEDRVYGFRMLGRLEMQEGDLPAAGHAFDQALAAGPNDALLWVDIGRMRYRGGEQRQAIEASINALQLAADNPRVLEFRGQLVRDAQGFRAALPFFAKGLKHAPGDLSLMGEYAATLGELGRARQMLAITRKMIEADPKSSRAFFLQAVLAARAGKYHLAKMLFWRTDEDFRETAAAELLGGILELKAGNTATAIDYLERLYRLQPDNPRAETLLARALWEAGRNREVVERFGAQALRADASPYLTMLIGRALEAQGDRAEAAIYLDRAAQVPRIAHALVSEDLPLDLLKARWAVDPGNADVTVPYVRQLIADRRFAEASDVAEGQLTRFGGSAQAQMLAGDAKFAAGDFPAAMSRYSISAQIRLSKPLLRRMVLSYQALGQSDRSRRLLLYYAVQHPRDGEVAGLLADNAMARQDWHRAKLLLDCALRLGGGERDPRLLVQRSIAELGIGDRNAARIDAGKAYQWQRASGRISRVLALAIQNRGKASGDSGILLEKAERIEAGILPAS